MKTVVAIPVMGSYEIGRISLYQWDRTASPDCQFLLIDNTPGPSQYADLFERGFLSLDRWCYVKHPENIGLIRSCQQAYNFAHGYGADILVLTHNDVWLYPNIEDYSTNDGSIWCWDNSLAHVFESNRKAGHEIGVIGLFGSKGCGREGHRLDTFGSLIEMAGHGRKMTDWIEPAVCVDGFFMACSMGMLKAAGGFDQRYDWHHVYDYDTSLTSLSLGYRNAVLNLPCHHLSGLTANNAAYATSGPDIHHANYLKWLQKWEEKLGVTVNDEWEYRWGLR